MEDKIKIKDLVLIMGTGEEDLYLGVLNKYKTKLKLLTTGEVLEISDFNYVMGRSAFLGKMFVLPCYLFGNSIQEVEDIMPEKTEYCNKLMASPMVVSLEDGTDVSPIKEALYYKSGSVYEILARYDILCKILGRKKNVDESSEFYNNNRERFIGQKGIEKLEKYLQNPFTKTSLKDILENKEDITK